jgi:hypothetical protein
VKADGRRRADQRVHGSSLSEGFKKEPRTRHDHVATNVPRDWRDPRRTQARCGAPLSVPQIDNEPRVRDGYIRLGTRGHARTLKTRREGANCRKNMAASARRCTSVPPGNLHGKEGVDGSSPSEGSKIPAKRNFCCLIWYNRAPPSQGGDRRSTATPHLRELLEINDVSLAPRPRCEAGDRFWGRMTAGLGRMARRRVH